MRMGRPWLSVEMPMISFLKGRVKAFLVLPNDNVKSQILRVQSSIASRSLVRVCGANHVTLRYCASLYGAAVISWKVEGLCLGVEAPVSSEA